jgi:ADP-dependent NAD(P)H-hydrate dehydratase / NAD(P)H-hydrate epimerase
VVTIATHVETALLLETQSPEVMKVGLASGTAGFQRLQSLVERATTIVVGPGLGFSADARVWVDYIANHFEGTVVVDADALTQLSGWSRRGNLVFTPHPGEAARLLECTSSEIESDRFGALERLIQHTDSVVVLKGAPSLVGDKGARYVTHDGAPCMSTAGSGDVLTGVIAALACQLSSFDAAWVGAWVHAAAGELWALTRGHQRGMLASELADNVPLAIASLS